MSRNPNAYCGFLLMLVAHAILLVGFLGSWEYATTVGLIDPTFFGRPSRIGSFLVDGFVHGTKMWWELGWTFAGTICAFLLGSVAAIITGFMFVSSPWLERFLNPYLSALNAMPRIALAPLFILWFGLGLGSKVAVGVTLTYFVVLASATAGIRGVSQDHVVLMNTLGAKPYQLFWRITLPNAVPVIFSGLRLGLIYALLGVVGTEIIASQHGIGQQLSYFASMFNMSGVMGLLFVLAMVASVINLALSRVEDYLRRWQ